MRPRATITLILALACGLAAGCGGDEENGEPIPSDQAAALQRQLESIENRFQSGGGACADITGNADPNTTAVRSVLDSLPEGVDPELRDALERSFERLFELVQEQCDEQAGQEEEPAPVEPEPTELELLPEGAWRRAARLVAHAGGALLVGDGIDPQNPSTRGTDHVPTDLPRSVRMLRGRPVGR
jgi:hypothetical protein